jgi:hypothetical protein
MATSLQDLKRKVHHRRFTEILAAYVFEKADKKLKAGALYKELQSVLQDAGNKFRKLVDDNAPLFYVLDLEEVATIIKEELAQNVQSVSASLRGYKTEFKVGGKATLMFRHLKIPGSDQLIFSDAEIDFYTNFSKYVLTDDFVKLLAALMKRELRKSISSKIAIKSRYESNLKILFDNYVKELVNITTTEVTSATYYKYGRVSVKYGKLFKSSLFGSTKVFIATDGDSIVPVKNKNTLVIVSDSFTGGKKVINDALQIAADKLLNSRGAESKDYNPKKPLESFKIGNLIDIGHTSAFVSGGGSIGVNMPAAQEVYVRLPSNKAQELEAKLSDIYADLNLQINFNQNFTELGGTLLNIGTAFAVVMRKSVNSTLLRTVENRIIATYKSELEKSVTEVLGSKEVRVALEQDIPLNGSASPTLVEFFNNLLLYKLDPKRYKNPTLKKPNKQTASKKAKLANSVKPTGNKSKKSNTSSKAAPTSITIKNSLNQQNIVRTSIVNLTSLLGFINSRLQDVISANMGDGDSRNVLNYRTGRLASSAKVESLSESRAGMITAFYSYMKNPYATFSDGGKQSSPRSRDPKLLISKSIREIAAQQVGNRLRAVNI